MPPTAPLLLDLTGVARLADVQRPVASMWRSRFARAADPFPPPISARGGRPLFDALAIASWLERTGRGHNREAIADVAASAIPSGFDISDPEHLATIDGLLALHAASGEVLDELSVDELHIAADTVDPEDTCLRSEVGRADATWREWATLLADAAYSPAQASRILERRHAATRSASGAAGPLSREAEELLLSLVTELTVGRGGHLVIGDGITSSLAADLLALSDDIEPVVATIGNGRAIRRRRLLDECDLPATAGAAEASRLLVARFPTGTVASSIEILDAIDDLVVEMSDDDCAIVLAPSAALLDSISGEETRARTDILRSGRVRAIVRLPAGLVTAAPRSSLALWVFGRPVGDVPIADRVTAVADLSDTRLRSASRADLTSDVLAALGGVREIHAHAFRFARLLTTSRLLAARGALQIGAPAAPTPSRSSRELPALLDHAHAALGSDVPRAEPVDSPGSTLEPSSIDRLRRERHLRLISGIRLTPQEIVASGFVVVGSAELDDPSLVGSRHVERLSFPQLHPTATLTRPGDVVFRTGPTPKAWVDPDGSKVVAHPARVLRIDAADPGGLLPELVATDISRSLGGPGAWRRWILRRVDPRAVPALRAALADIASQRADLARRMSALDDYSELLAAGIASGVVTLTDAVDAASDPQ